jgi:hypothetical protein
MSVNARKNVSIRRAYEPASDACVRALITLLKVPVSNEGSPVLATLDDTRGEIQRDSRTKSRIPK